MTEDLTEVLVGSELGSGEKPTEDVGRLRRKERRKLDLEQRGEAKKAAKRAQQTKGGR